MNYYTIALGSDVLGLLDVEGLISYFPLWGNLRTGGAQAVPVRPEGTRPTICPVAALQQYVEAVRTCQWDMGRGYPFPAIKVDGPIQATKRDAAMTPQLMTGRMKAHTGRSISMLTWLTVLLIAV